MIHRITLLAATIALVLLLLGCAPSAPASTPTSPAPPTQSNASTASNRQTPLPLPPQPTSLPIAPRTPSPFQSPAPAQIVLGPTVPPRATNTAAPTAAQTRAATVASTSAPTIAPTVAATATSQPRPTTSSPAPAAPGTTTGRRSEVKLTFLTPLKEAEEAEPVEMEPLRAELKKMPGFFDMSGDENSVTVGYDAGLLTVEQIIQRFADLKHPVKRQ